MLRINSFSQRAFNSIRGAIKCRFILVYFFQCDISTMASASAFQAEDDSSILLYRSKIRKVDCNQTK